MIKSWIRKQRLLKRLRELIHYHVMMHHWKAAGIMVDRYKRVQKL